MRVDKVHIGKEADQLTNLCPVFLPDIRCQKDSQSLLDNAIPDGILRKLVMRADQAVILDNARGNGCRYVNLPFRRH